ncbi:MAG TPA: alpha-amylase family glycosyl hydrolase [Gemmataceae bacterium]|jgi:alpha-amylase|nr:alpha-amylase family glycosyl hydrolase [Gemmataceae bacterium]
MRFHAHVSVVLVAIFAIAQPSFGQAGFDDDRVMLQGFYWESYRHGDPDPKFAKFGAKRWYEIVKDQADTIREGHFDLIWLPPPSYAGARSAGYNPKQYWKLDNSYGDFTMHRAMLEHLLKKGIEPIADIVINHRDGDTTWADFKNPDWGLDTITKFDEVFTNPMSPQFNTSENKRGADEEKPSEYTTHGGTTYAYGSFRDIDHTNKQVRRDIIKYLLQLKSAGYRGWRYDMVHGYHAKRLALYNERTNPTFSVGEYDWDKHAEQRGWIWWTATKPDVMGVDHLKTSSNVFDFSTNFTLKDNKGNYKNWYALDNGLGMMGDNTDAMPWKQRAVTFLENHDTGYRTDEDGNPEKNHERDQFLNGWEVEQGYAYILTHPGVPSVYWKHYFDWGTRLQSRIKALINARKVAGVKSGSTLYVQQNAKAKGVYAARIQGVNGDLFVRVGGTDADWQPSTSNYKDYREYTAGEGWRVWVAVPGNPDVRQAPLKDALPIPQYKKPQDIEVPDAWLDHG